MTNIRLYRSWAFLDCSVTPGYEPQPARTSHAAALVRLPARCRARRMGVRSPRFLGVLLWLEGALPRARLADAKKSSGGPDRSQVTLGACEQVPLPARLSLYRRASALAALSAWRACRVRVTGYAAGA